jgi:hypothetical protein
MVRGIVDRRLVALLCVLAVCVLGVMAADPPAAPPAAKSLDSIALHKQLRTPVKFSGFDDPKTTLGEALQSLGDRNDVRFEINDRPFVGMADDLSSVLVAERPIPKMSHVRLELALQKVLRNASRVLGTNLTYVIRSDHVEITTEEAVRAEFYPGREEGPLAPLVHARFSKKPLAAALDELADQAQATVVLDVRAGDKAETPVSARFANVPLDTAVKLLADMADLKSISIDGILYVTSKDNARELHKEQAPLQAPGLGMAGPLPEGAGGPLQAELERMLRARDEQIEKLKATLNQQRPREPNAKDR